MPLRRRTPSTLFFSLFCPTVPRATHPSSPHAPLLRRSLPLSATEPQERTAAVHFLLQQDYDVRRALPCPPVAHISRCCIGDLDDLPLRSDHCDAVPWLSGLARWARLVELIGHVGAFACPSLPNRRPNCRLPAVGEATGRACSPRQVASFSRPKPPRFRGPVVGRVGWVWRASGRRLCASSWR